MTGRPTARAEVEPARLRRQRELVERLHRQLAFEILVLERLEARIGFKKPQTPLESVADVAAEARRRLQRTPDR